MTSDQTMTAEDARQIKVLLDATGGTQLAVRYRRILATYTECERLRAQLATAQEDSARHVDEKISLAEKLVAVTDLLDGVTKALDGVSDVWVSTDHPEFGIEVTMVIGDKDVTLTNQPSILDAFTNARAALDSARGGTDNG